MSGLNKVVWAEGVFLGQQHFQAWDRFQSNRLNFIQKSQSSFHWGLVSLTWNEMALSEGRLELQKLEAILPEGRAIEFRRDQEAPVFLDLAAVGRDEFTVMLAVPNNALVEGVAGYQSAGRIGGWKASFQELPDDSDVSRTREVMMAKPNIQLRTEFDALDQMSCLRLVKIQRQYDGEFKIIHDIIPASLTLNALPPLRDIAQATCDMVANLIREFAKTREKIGDISSYSSTELSDFLFNKELAIWLPDLRANLEQSIVHPYTLYGQLAKLHQHCATFLAPEYLDRVPAYQHDCLEEVLPALVMQIRGMLSSKKERPEDKIEMKALSPGRFETSQIPRHALENFNFYLAVDAKQDSADWIPRFPQLVKLAAPEQLETVIASGLPGVTLQHIQRLPQKIRIKSGYEYFQISTESDLWNAVLQAQQFAVFCMGEFADATIELIVMDEK